MTGKIEFLLLPLGPYTNTGFRARSFPRASGGTPRFTSQIAIPTLRMRPDFRSWLRYKRATSATTFSRQKPVPSYDPAPVHPSFRPLFHRSPATKSPPMRPHFRRCSRYNRATNATSFSYEKLHHSYELGRISYENAPSRPMLAQIGNIHECDHPSIAGSDTTVRPVRPRPPHPSPAIGSGLSRWNYHGLCGRVAFDKWARPARPSLLFQSKQHTMALIPTGKVSEK